MKLTATVKEVKASGSRLTVTLKAPRFRDEFIYSNVTHEMELPDTDAARKAYFIGRPVVITINPK